MRKCNGPINGSISHIVISGTTSNSYKLPKATDKILGGIKIGEDFSTLEDGTLYIDIEALIDKLGNDAADKHYEHRQNTPSRTWTIQHNLNKKPSVTVLDSANSEVIGEVIYIDDNNLELHFSAQFSGIAYLN